MYMFDENKNKVDVKVIKTSSQLTNSGSAAIWEYDADDLEELGIDDIGKYTILAVNQQTGNSEKWYAFKTDSSDTPMPTATITRVSPDYPWTLRVLGYFYDEFAASAQLTCTVVLMRTEN